MQRHRLDDKNINQLFVAEVRPFFERADREHQKAWRTEATLQRVMTREGLLHRVQSLATLQAFDCTDPALPCLHREHKTCTHWLVVK